MTKDITSVRDAVEVVKRQISEHRRAEARYMTAFRSAGQYLESLLSEKDARNHVFPWLSASFVNKLLGVEPDSVIPSGILNVVYLYKILEQLSSGRGFRTFLGVMRRNDLWCNIRTYDFGDAKNSSFLAHKEARVLAMTSGNRFFDKLITCFKTLNGFYIITGHVKSTPLHNFIKRQERFNDEELRFYAEELVCAIEFLHSKSIVHRNLTAGNIKLTAEGHIKVFNLEQAHICQDDLGRDGNKPKIEGQVGLDAYMSPEMVDGKIYGYTIDWWNLGVILYFMISGEMPFKGNNKRELHKAIKYNKPMFEQGLHEHQTHALIKDLLRKDPSKRLGFHGAKEVKEHAYFNTTDWTKVLTGKYDPPFLPETSAVTSLPSGLCHSLEHLSGSEPEQKSSSRREIERQQEFNLAPSQYIEFELEHDWTKYLIPDISLELALHYLHGELRPPIPEDDLLTIEECISKAPELSADEKNLFRKYAELDVADLDLEEFASKSLDKGKFRMVNKAEVELSIKDGDAEYDGSLQASDDQDFYSPHYFLSRRKKRVTKAADFSKRVPKRKRSKKDKEKIKSTNVLKRTFKI